eukprot:g1062.t1
MAGGTSIFAQGSAFNSGPVAWCMAGLIALSFIMELGIEKLEESCQDSEAKTDILRKLFTELMILGCISFTVVMGVQTKLMGHSKVLAAFEFAHILIFFVALVLIVQALLSFRHMARVNAAWRAQALRPTSKLKEQWDDVHDRARRRRLNCCLRLRRLVCESAAHRRLRHEIRFHVLRSIFLDRASLPLDFDFATYLSHCLTHRIGEVVEVDKSSWAAMFVITCGLGAVASWAWASPAAGEQGVAGTTWSLDALVIAYSLLGFVLVLAFVLLVFVADRSETKLISLVHPPAVPDSIAEEKGEGGLESDGGDGADASNGRGPSLMRR